MDIGKVFELEDKTMLTRWQVGTQIMAPNIIKTISGNTITFKIPLTDNLNSVYMKAEVRAYTPPEPTSEMGVANLQIEAGADTCSGTRLDYTTCN